MRKRISSKWFYVVYFCLTLLVVLRKGQGSDYYNYELIYDQIESLSNTSFLAIFILRDPGFSVINYLSIALGIKYELFSAIFTFMIMSLFFPYFNRTCQKSMIAIFLFYTTFYLVYPFSAIRQGFTIAIFLSILFPLLEQKKYFKFYLILILASSIHMSVLICGILPFLVNLNFKTSSWIIFAIPLTIIMLLDLNIFKLLPFNLFSERIDAYVGDGTSNKYLAKIVRILCIFPLFLISDSTYRSELKLRMIRNILIIGYFIYCLLSFTELTSSRLHIYFKAFEGLFLIYLLYHTTQKKLNLQIVIYYILINCILYFKDINGFIGQGNYKNCNIITYPYFSIFDSDEKIDAQRRYKGFIDDMK